MIGELWVASLSLLRFLLLDLLFLQDYVETEAGDLDLVIFFDRFGPLTRLLLPQAFVDELSRRDSLDAGHVIVCSIIGA